MRRNYDRQDSGMGGVFQAFLIGALLGAVGVFFSDERNRKRARVTMDDWKHKAEDMRDEVASRAEDMRDEVTGRVADLKQEGLKRVSDELDRTQKKVDKRRS